MDDARPAEIPASVSAHPTLCIGIATCDDFDGAWFTIQAIRLYHREALEGVSFVVVDNDPDSPGSQSLRDLGGWIADYTYVPFRGFKSTAVRDLIFAETEAEIVLCLDSHVLLRPGAIAALRAWFATHPKSRDLLQGPLISDDLSGFIGTHRDSEWSAGMYGRWAIDPRIEDPDREPFEIPFQGMGLFACRREVWPGFNPRMRGFGGGEGYVQEKFRRAGGRVLCHPGLAWLHRFERPRGVPYPNAVADRVRNYVVCWEEIGWSRAAIEEHFRDLLGEAEADSIFAWVDLQLAHPFHVFDALFCLRGDQHSHPPEVGWHVEHLPPAVTDDDVGDRTESRPAGFRDAIATAARRRYRTVLISDDIGVPVGVVVPSAATVATAGWDVWFATGPGESPTVAVHERAFQALLDQLPSDEDGQNDLSAQFGDVVGFLRTRCADGTLVALPTERVVVGSDRPRKFAGVEMLEVEDGVVARRVDANLEHRLNNTAAIVLDSADGTASIPELAGVVAELFDLAEPPVGEVIACIDQLRRAGLIEEQPAQVAS